MRPRLGNLGLGLLAATACSGGVSNTDGLKAGLRVSGATFFQHAEPAPDPQGATVMLPQASNSNLYQLNISVSGEVSNDTAAVALHLEGDIGYWTVPAGPGEFTPLAFSAAVSFNPAAIPADGGIVNIDLNAIDAKGVFGPTTVFPLTAIGGFPSGADLVVSLHWDTESDLDLHVVTPDGTELWSEKRSTYTSPPYPKPSASPATIEKYYGYLDYDSNRMCVIDGRREENVIWQTHLPDAGPYPPLGHYEVKLDTWSLCGQSFANYDLTVYRSGTVLSQVSGVALPIDERPPHGADAGFTILTFDILPDAGMGGGEPDAGPDAGPDGG